MLRRRGHQPGGVRQVAGAVPRGVHCAGAARPEAGGGGRAHREGPAAAGRHRHRGQAAGGRARDHRGAAEGRHPRVGADGRQAGDGHQHRLLVQVDRARHAADPHQRGQPGQHARVDIAAQLGAGGAAVARQQRHRARGGRQDAQVRAEPRAAEGLHRVVRGVQGGDLLPRVAHAEGRGGRAGDAAHACRHAGHRRRRQRRRHDPEGARGRGYFGRRGAAGGLRLRLQHRAIPLSTAAAPSARRLELLAPLQINPLQFLQEHLPVRD